MFYFAIYPKEDPEDPGALAQDLALLIEEALGPRAEDFTIESYVGAWQLLYENWDDFSEFIRMGLRPGY